MVYMYKKMIETVSLKGSSSSKGFTLIEMIIVISILAILSSFAIPKFFGYTERAKIVSDKASLWTLNSATTYYALFDGANRDDIFFGVDNDEDRMALLIQQGYLAQEITSHQENGSFKWVVDGQMWMIFLNGEVVALSPLGSTFDEIVPSMLKAIEERYELKGSYGRTFGDYTYTDIGLDPADWVNPINHIFYKPGGSKLSLRPEDGYSFFVTDIEGNTREMKSSYNWNIIYDDTLGKWYYHKVSKENEILVDEMRVELTKTIEKTKVLPIPAPLEKTKQDH